MSDKKIKIIIVDDHPVLREGLKTVLELNGGFTVVAETDDGNVVKDLIAAKNPDIILMDIRMEKLDGISASRIVKRAFPDVKILLLTMHDDEHYIKEALEIGVEGYILKMSDMKNVVNAINTIYEDETYYDPKITKSVAEKSYDNNLKNSYEEILHKFKLSNREIEIATYIVNGYSYKQISEMLCLSQFTVYNHKRNIFAKLNIKRTNELISLAINSGLFIIK